MNYQKALDDLISETLLSPLLEDHLDWYRENTRFLRHRMGRLKMVKSRLEKKENPTEKQKRYLNRYRGKLTRISGVQQHREYLMLVAQLRIKRSRTRQ